MIQRTLLLIPLVLYPLGLTWAEDWPQWRGPERTGVSKEKGLLEAWPAGGPKLLWTFRDAGPGYSSMAVVGDRLYSMGGECDKDCVFAIDLKTQKKLWSVEVGMLCLDTSYGDGPRSTPTVDGHFLYATGGFGDLVCVDTASGKKVWSQELETLIVGRKGGSDGYCESPLVDGGLVVVTLGGQKGEIAAFDKKTGALKWHTTSYPKRGGDKSFSSMIAIEVGGVRQYVAIPGYKSVVGVRALDGKPLWSFPLSKGINTPIYRNDCVYVASQYGCKLVKLRPDGDQFKAEPIYDNKELLNEFGGVILVGEHLYGYSLQGAGWMCQDFKTGKTVWHKKTDANVGHASAIYAAGNLYYYHYRRGDVLLVQATASGYQEQGKFCIPELSKLPRPCAGNIWTCPVVANGKLYLRDQDLIFCYDIRKPQ